MWKKVRRHLGWIILGLSAVVLITTYAVSSYVGYAVVRIKFGDYPKAWEQAKIPAATIGVDGESVTGSASYSVRVRPGIVRVTLSHPLFKTWQRFVEVRKGESIDLIIPLVPLARKLTIQALPDDAVVLVDDQRYSPNRGALVLDDRVVGQTYSIQVKAPKFRLYSGTVSVPSPADVTIKSLPLERRAGDVTITLAHDQIPSDDFEKVAATAECTLDGRKLTTWSSIAAVDEGQHVLEFTHPDYVSKRVEIAVTDKGTTSVVITLVPRPSTLSLAITPQSIPVVLTSENGKVFDLNNGSAMVEPGVYRMRLSSVGYVAQEHDFTFKPNQRYQWAAQLVRVGEQEFAQAAAEFERQHNAEALAVLSRYEAARFGELNARVEEIKAMTDLLAAARNLQLVNQSLAGLVTRAMAKQKLETSFDDGLREDRFAAARIAMAEYRGAYSKDAIYDEMHDRLLVELQRWALSQVDQLIAIRNYSGARSRAIELNKADAEVDTNALLRRINGGEIDAATHDCEALVMNKLQSKRFDEARKVVSQFYSNYRGRIDLRSISNRIESAEADSRPGYLVITRSNSSSLGNVIGTVWNTALLGAEWFDIIANGQKIGSVKEFSNGNRFKLDPGQYDVRIEARDRTLLIFSSRNLVASGSATIKPGQTTTLSF